MSEKIILHAKIRKPEEKANALRQKGFLPAVVYGHNENSQSLTLDYNHFLKIFKTAGTSSLINLKINEAEPVNVLIEEVQHDPRSDKVIHVDFHKVKMTEKIHTEISLIFEGEAPGVKELGGTLVKNRDQIEVECLPGDLVHEIKIDLGVLKNLHDAVHIKDLDIPKTIAVLADPEEVVVTVQPTKVEEEPKPEEVVTEVPAGEQPPVEGEETAQTEEKTKVKE